MKMETPKMDVVRFQEADVLAASQMIASSFALTGFNNGKANDAKIDGADAASAEAINVKLGNLGNSYFQYQNNDPVHYGDLHDSDVAGPINDGTYVDQGDKQITDTIFGRLWYCQ